MHCPVCKGVALVMTERQGIEIDYCPQCRGVWLDRGELDKIIERATAASVPLDRSWAQQWKPGSRERVEYKEYDDGYYYRKKKKRGFLGELFDFD